VEIESVVVPAVVAAEVWLAAVYRLPVVVAVLLGIVV
jgi:hypothetical protein